MGRPLIGVSVTVPSRAPPPGGSRSTAAVSTSLTVLMTACDAEYLYWLLNNAVLKYELESSKDYETAPTAPDPSCQSVISAGGVGPKQVDSKWKFTRP